MGAPSKVISDYDKNCSKNFCKKKQYILAGQNFFNWMICESDQGLPSEEFPESRVGWFS